MHCNQAGRPAGRIIAMTANRWTSRRFLPALALGACALASLIATAQSRTPLSSADIDDIATLVKLEDTRTLDEAALARILKSTHTEVRRRAVVAVGRIAKEQGRPLLVGARADTEVEVLASVAFATGQLKHPAAVEWLGGLLDNPRTSPIVGREAAQALGKIQTPDARAALNRFVASVTDPDAVPVVGDALLSLGRFTGRSDLTPIVRWLAYGDSEIRWRGAWALFRLRDPAGVPHLLKLADDRSADVRYWAVRGLTPALVDQAALDRAAVSLRLRAAVKDNDRRVRTEALRVLLTYDDDGAFAELLAALKSTDTWVSTSAAEAASRFASRAPALTPALITAGEPDKPLWLRHTVLTPLVTLSAGAAIDVATSMAREDSAVARASAVQAFGRLGAAGRARLDELSAEPALKGLLPTSGAGRGGGGAGGAPQPAAPVRTDADYRRLVEKWIVPDYNGRPRPRAIWQTVRGTIELELFAGDAPMGAEYFMKSIESGDIVGTEFGRVVPNFVAQQNGIRNAPRLRDEVNRRGLTEATLAWASAGLDTGRPGYTLSTTPQPHNEGNFTALGRIVRGLDVMDKLEWGDTIVSARIK